jgi:mono/diheme cytochrome c family protein
LLEKNEMCENIAICDTTNMSFATDIQPIINTNCIGCHSSGSGTSGGYDLTTYAGVKSAVTASKLYESVAQNGAAVSMPPASKLSQCKIDQIKSWIDAGAPNN